MENNQKEIIVYKLAGQSSNLALGFLSAVAEKVGDSYIPLDSHNFCPSGKVFVTHGYDEIDARYKENELFKVIVKETEFKFDDDIKSDKNCEYVTKASEAANLKPREMVEVISCPLPNPNSMILNTSETPSTVYVYVNDGGTCYGPFKWALENEGQVVLKKLDSPLPGKGKGLSNGTLYTASFKDLKKYSMKCDINHRERVYFESMADLHNDAALEKMDYFSDEDIVSNFIKLSKEIGFSGKKIDLAYLEINVKKHPKHSHKASIDKLALLKDIANDQILFRKEVIDEFGKFFKSELGEAITKAYINVNKDAYLTQIRDDYRAKLENEFIERTNEIEKLIEKISINKQELVDLGRDIEARNKIKINTNILGSLKENDDLDAKISQKEEQLKTLNEQIKPLLETYSVYSSMEEVEKELASTRVGIEYELKRKLQIQDEVGRLEALYNQDEDKLRTKLFEMKPFVEVINGNTGAPTKEMVKKVMQDVVYVETETDNAQNIIKHIEHGLRGENRNFSILDVINITVTLQQSFISFLAGLPGGGKTTLARLVAKIYGIQENRFLDVPVARGWTGQRDLIGFFNPISNKFQSSSTGMYEFLSALSDEAQDKDSNAPLSMVLLDEANLSPMEHYWSSFMGLTDSRGTEGLQLGDKHVQIPDNLRFISTVNYDSTTEYLSPRLIDRAPVIVLEPNTIITTSNQRVDEDTAPLIEVPISYKTMEKFFGLTDDIPEFVGPELTVYDAVKEVLEERNSELGKPVIISNRKEIAIRQYCNKARPLMREFSTDDDLLAIDYAILQLILPLLRGHGKSFGKRLEKLRDVLIDSDLDRSVSYMDTIISNGNADLNTYDFFCW